MATLGEVFDEFNPEVTLYATTGENGMPLIRAEFTILPSELATLLPQGEEGDPGPAGEVGPPQDFRGYITDDAALTGIAATLGAGDKGKVWANTVNSNIHYWNGSSFDTYEDSLAVPGEDGPAVNLTLGTVTTSPADGFADIELTGSAPNQVLNLTLPAGATGPEGPPGPAAALTSATDYDGSTPAVDGDVIVWDDSLNVWKPQQIPRPGGVFSLINTDFSTTLITGTSGTVASIVVPDLGVPYRVFVSGILRITTTGATDVCRAIVQNASAVVVGTGVKELGTGTRTCNILPFSSVSLTPDSSHAVFPAGASQTFSVILNLDSGTADFQVVSAANINGLQLMVVPV